MRKTLRHLISIFLLGIIAISPFFVKAAAPAPNEIPEVIVQEKVVNIYFFYSKTCPHCHEEAIFLASLQQEYGESLKIYSYEVTGNSANATLMYKFGQEYGVNVGGVPATFIAEQDFIGYGANYTDVQISNLVKQCLATNCHDLGRHVLFPDEECEENEKTETGECEEKENKIKVPIFGEIDLKNTSLFVATIILGGLDGFNPCAMWVLIFLISLLLNIESPRRRWILGITFIIGSALVYYLFMAAWLNLFLYVGYLFVARLIIGVLAISFGTHNLIKYFKKRAGTCEISTSESNKKLMHKLQNFTQRKNLIPAMLGILIVAFLVNFVELACSAGFPAVYTSLLGSQNFTPAVYYFYLLLYVLIFMLDDIIVFIIAMVTLKLTGLDSKYAKISTLIGGIIILILGFLLIIKPDWLMFS